MDSTTQQERQASRARLVVSTLRHLAVVMAVALIGGVAAAAPGPSPESRTGVAANDTEGLRVARGGVLFGNARRTKSPAKLDLKRAWKATPEARKIDAEGIQKGSAEYGILKTKAIKRIRAVLKHVAATGNHDCVVKEGSVTSNPGGLKITDITDDVVSELENAKIDDVP